MRGRRPEKLTIARRDQEILQAAAHNGSLPCFQVQRAKIGLAIAAEERRCSVAARLECDESTVWRACERYRQEGLASLFADGRQGNSGRRSRISPVQQAQIVELACLEPIAKGLHLTHWSSEDLARQVIDDKILPPSARQRFAEFCTTSICNLIGLGIGRHLGWMPGSRRGRSKSFGAMPMRIGFRNKASGWCVSMRSRLSRFWSVTRSAERSLGQSSNRSSITPGTGR